MSIRPPPGVRALRWGAIAIAVAAVIDPSLTSTRRTDATIAVIAGKASESALAARVADELEDAFTVVRGPFTAGAATVLVGARVPEGAHALPRPAFAVLPDAPEPRIELRHVAAPMSAQLDTRVTFQVLVRVVGGASNELDVTLHTGDVVLDRVPVRITSADEHMTVPLTYIPAGTGANVLRVSATLDGAAAVERDITIDVHEQRLAVLFLDGRPSWASTFVRRALEQDARFIVDSRVATSRGVALETGQPPASPGERAATAAYDAIVIGSPAMLAAADVAALERYLRERGGAVVLLLDEPAVGPYTNLAGVPGWTHVEHDTAVALRGAGRLEGLELRGRDLLRPTRLPAGMRVLAQEAGAGAPAVWRTPIGAGRLVISGATDAWQYRDPESSDFDAFWRTLIGDIAAASPAPLELGHDGGGVARAVAPGERVMLELLIRDAALAPLESRDSVVAYVSAHADGGELVRFWPDVARGRFTVSWRAPADPGTYVINAMVDGAGVRMPIVVAGGAETGDAGDMDRDVIAAWTSSRGGATISAGRLDDLTGALRAGIAAERRREPWHPMRSAWWIVPFAALLGAEWRWRRRRGLP